MNDDAYVERASVLLRDGESEGSTSAGGGAAHSRSDPSGYYGFLGVSPTATQQEIRRAFLFLSQRYHTDKHSNQSEDVQSLMNDRFQQLQEAYTVLSDERQRAAYDAGGDRGIQRLSLVPAGLRKREDILQYVLSLDREAQLLQTSKMVSASSQATITFTTAHIFPFQAAGAPGEGEEDAEEDGEEPHGAAAVATPTLAAEGRSNATVQPSAAPTENRSASARGHGSSSSSSSASPLAAAAAAATGSTDAPAAAAAASKRPAVVGASHGGSATADTTLPEASGGIPSNGSGGGGGSGAGPAMKAQLTAKEVVIDGKRQIVLVPDAGVQQQLRQRMHGELDASDSGASAASSSSKGNGVVRSGSQDGGLPAFHRLSPTQALVLASMPKSMTFRSSFQHMLTPKLVATFRTDAASQMRKGTSSFTTLVEYQPDEVRTYATSLRFAVMGLKWCLYQRRELTPLWAMKSKLTALTGTQLLQKLELTLIRKLSPTAVLESALAMSLNEHGFFRSSINDFSEDAQQGVSAYIGFHTLHLTAYTGGKVVLGVDTKDPKNPPAYGRLQYTINCSPLAGQTTLGVEAWYCPSKVQHYGLGFTTVLPYSVSPIAPPLFFVESTQFAVVNQISFLYARGQHRISVPVIVFISPKVSQGLVWMSVPLTVYRIATTLYKPYARAKAARYYAQQRRLHIAETDVAREKARLEQLALENLVLMSRATEERKGGLVIINARYGVIDPQFAEITTTPATPAAPRTPTPPPSGSPSNNASAPQSSPMNAATPPRRRTPTSAAGRSSASTKGWWPSQVLTRIAERLVNGLLRRRANAAAAAKRRDEGDAYEAARDAVGNDAIPLFIDVTIAVQNLVRDSALSLPAGTKSTLVGFCDPDPYTPEQKSLKIVYWFRKRKHVAIFADDVEVELPQREHLIT
ncbi:hypothetical protein ABL78_3699 [Leptomonas seymouri]|uniref:J domain-containing protein n=1 Tax=Leptomonas seymouri TaxID=5684 RepID=A0A0N0P653_LEPSE|nr:hypothetical protein ABL78_3699 [Leptomonas seymouri]|eukprot:KPI87229.1 hypothetical protein ABL78_3699 [Leptomonas seymouri]